MLPEVTCCVYFYVKTSLNLIVFTKFDNYFIINHDRNNIIIVSHETLVLLPNLFKIYILSLLVTEDTRNVIKTKTKYSNKIIYTLPIKYQNMPLFFNETYKNVYIGKRNPLNKLEPKRESSLKKINKFIKNFNKTFEYDSPNTLIEKFIESEINIEQNEINKILLKHYNDNTISLLTGIKKKYGTDIYDKIRIFLIKIDLNMFK
jgi:hypothetical protein